MQKNPLADRMRPKSFEEFFGQEKIVGEGKILKSAILGDKIPSMIFWGPPGSGKTTLAHIIAQKTGSEFVALSAINSGVKDLRREIERAEDFSKIGKCMILFIDEIHRFNKSQQDFLLPYVERGVIIFIGATTENPSFEVNNALLSRCRVFVLNKLETGDLKKIIMRAVKNKECGLGSDGVKIGEKEIKFLAEMSDGDARVALSVLEFAASINKIITKQTIEDALQKTVMYDKNGEEHYNLISALHKSMRGSDADAALYYLARMVAGGEDPLYIARRLIRFASEDIGIANSNALSQAVATYQAVHFIGYPECSVNLAQAVVYMAKSKKSNKLYTAYNAAQKDIESFGALPVPLHLRNVETKLIKDLDYGKGYKYSPEFDYAEDQEYLPDKLKGKKYLDF
ncbi:MAG: replication-associated recombination protein A [Candidatus Pacebacteria bacterium]|nr:replication-associated recombination protein A [Candidatus Paceibacterota bacterium]